MKIVVAVDSFKGSLSSLEIGKCVKENILKVDSQIEVVVKGIADGGEGTVEVLADAYHGEIEEMTVLNAYGQEVSCRYMVKPQEKLAVIEVAEAIGLAKCQRREPRFASTYGVGQVILACLDERICHFIIGLGGSATNDAGLGMMMALGMEVTFQNDLFDILAIENIDISHIDPRLKQCDFTLACDVKNPLCGDNGATSIYGPQKGVKEIDLLDAALSQVACDIERLLGESFQDKEGAGAAGGLGFAFLAFFNSRMQSGAELVIAQNHLETALSDADLVITGEGRIDGQTAMGKAPMMVAGLAHKYDIPVIGIGGSVQEEAKNLHAFGMTAFFSIQCEPHPLEKAMREEVTKAQIGLTIRELIHLFLKLQ